MNSRQKVFFIIVVILQLCVLAFMAGKQEYILASGEKILLKCEPVDPRSLFSGDYVILSYEITHVDLAKIAVKPGEDRSFDYGEMIYVALEKVPDARFWKASAVSRDIAWLKSRYKTVIMGRIYQYYNIKFGLEDYFVPQNEGKVIEQDLNNVYDEVSVTGSGASAISRLFLNGKEVRFY